MRHPPLHLHATITEQRHDLKQARGSKEMKRNAALFPPLGLLCGVRRLNKEEWRSCRRRGDTEIAPQFNLDLCFTASAPRLSTYTASLSKSNQNSGRSCFQMPQMLVHVHMYISHTRINHDVGKLHLHALIIAQAVPIKHTHTHT